jgi:dephospho-CoA kinase
MLIIGLTGGIGCGKSTVAKLFAALGIPVIDTDLIARDLVEPGQPALAEITARFGTDMLDARGRLDRGRLRQRVFTDAAERRALEAILHPRIRAESLKRIAELRTPYCILCVPLLVESGWTDLVDRVLVIDCPRELQIERAMARDGLSREQVEAIIASQTERERRLQAADDVIANDSDLGHVQRQVASLHKTYLTLATG